MPIRRSPSSCRQSTSKTLRRSNRDQIERLEPRRLFAVATASWFAGYLEAGTTWTLRTTTGPGESATFVDTNNGPTTFNGFQCTQITATSSDQSIVSKTYYSTDNAGNFIQYGEETQLPTGTQSDVYTPSSVNLPDSLTAGVTVTFTNTDLNTINTTAQPDTTVTYTETHKFTLLSETPTSITVPAGTYDTYQVTQVDSATGSDGSTVDPSTLKLWYAPDVGLVKSLDPDTGLVTELTNFEGHIRHLAVTQQPSDATFGDTISPAVKVALQDSTGATDTDAKDAVTITATLSPASTGQGKLSGTTSVATSGGVATFNDLSIDKPGQYTITFTDNTGRVVNSNAVDVSAGRLVFRNFPSEGVAGSIIRPGIKIALVNGKGKLITDAPSVVTLNITGSSIGYPIEGNTANLVNGVATFDALKLTKAAHYTLVASDANGDLAATSTDLEVKGPHLTFQIQPRKAGVDGRIRYGIVLKDPKNKTIFNSVDGVRLSLNVIGGPPTAALLGTSDVLVRGAAINDLQPYVAVNAPGTYSLTATMIQGAGSTTDVSSIEPITSNSFEVVQNKLVFTKQPHSGQANIALNYEIQLKDYKKKTVTSSEQLTFTLVVVKDGVGAALSNNSDSLLNGIANNDGNIPITINVPGTYQLTVAVVPSIPDDPIPSPVTSKIFKISVPKNK